MTLADGLLATAGKHTGIKESCTSLWIRDDRLNALAEEFGSADPPLH